MTDTFKAPRLNTTNWADLPTERERLKYQDTTEDNANRASAGMIALRAYAEESYGGFEELETVLQDLLGDLRHAADALALDYEGADRRGEAAYEAEIRGEL